MAVSETSPHVPLQAPLMPSREQYVHRTAAVGCTDFLKSDLSFTWKVNVKPLVSNGCELRSPTFKAPVPSRANEENRSSAWHLLLCNNYSVYLYFDGEHVEKVAANVVSAQSKAQSKFCIVDCVFSALDSKTDEVEQSETAKSELCENIGQRCGVSNFISKDKLDELIIDGVLTMKVAACLVYFMDPIQATIEAASPVLPSNVLDGLKKLHEEKNLTDISIKCGEKEFKAHKAILASQSPVLNRMLETDMKDNVIEVTDIDPDVMSDMLDFLYTGSAPNLNTLAKNLLYAASKYELPRLVVLCENELMLNLYVDNLFEMVQCAHTYEAVNLKRACLRMIKCNSVELFKSGVWKDFKTNSDQNLIYEVLEFNEE